MSSISWCGGLCFHVTMLLVSWLWLTPSGRAMALSCAGGRLCRLSAKVLLQDICLSCTAGIGHRLSVKTFCMKCICRVQAGQQIQIKSEKKLFCVRCTVVLVVHSRDQTQIKRKNYLHEMYPLCASGESDADREQKNFSAQGVPSCAGGSRMQIECEKIFYVERACRNQYEVLLQNVKKFTMKGLRRN